MSKDAGQRDYRSLMKKAVIDLRELRSKLRVLEHAKTEPIAIIGLGCRIPGGATTPEAFWQFLREGRDAITEVPTERWDVDTYYDPTPATPGKMYTRHGGFLAQVDQFDTQFFGISPREATSMDPQQRLLLEVSWEALEHAGHSRRRSLGSPTGVFVGITTSDYGQLIMQSSDLGEIDAYYGTGNTLNTIAGRVSYTLGLQGPTMALDTACSSSLVTVHLACQSLRAGECNLALAAGVNLVLAPEGTIFACQARMLAADGHCKTFDAAADGYVRSEGCGVVVLKRLSDAVAAGDNILAVIRGSAVNHDGPSSGFTVPNGTAQQSLIRRALDVAKVAPSDVHYIEAHGTGTSLGDPIEVQALAAVFGQRRGKDNPLMIGSVKTNIGHLEAAAGIAGLIKVVLALQHEEIPPHLHFNSPNPHIAWDEIALKVPTERMGWPRGKKKRIAGVSSFGFSGTNAHVIVEEAPVREVVKNELERPAHILTLSAKTEGALNELVTRYAEHLSSDGTESLADMCFSANAGRSHFAHRIALVGETASQVAQVLSAVNGGESPAGVRRGEVKQGYRSKIAFLFTGQGSQYVGMGRELYGSSPVFREALEHCGEILKSYLEQPLLSVLYAESGGSGLLDETGYTQPALFALEYALAELWQSWGIKPAWVMGHSVGEYVAACVAGVLSLEEGLKLISARGRLMQGLARGGAMAAVLGGEDRVRESLKGREEKVAIAGLNGPNNVVISGAGESVTEVVEELEREGIRSRKLVVSHAFHSPLMGAMLEEFAKVAAQISYCEPCIGLVSNVSGEVIRELDGSYWVQHVREAVRFEASMKTLQGQGVNVYLEVGPSATLLGMGRQCLWQGGGVWLPSLRKGREDWRQMLESLGQLYVHGVEVDWEGFDRPYPRRKVVLPPYPFQRQRYWLEADAGAAGRAGRAPELAETNIVRLLGAGDMARLAREVEVAGAFSEEEAKLLPKVLDALVKRHRQEVTAETIKDWLYEVEWQAKQEVRADAWSTNLAADYIPAAAEIAEHVCATEAWFIFEQGLNLYRKFLPEINALSAAYVIDAFSKLGWQFPLRERITIDSLMGKFAVTDQYRRLLGWMLGILREEGILRESGSAWEVCRIPVMDDPQKLWQALCNKYPAQHPELTLLGRCGPNLADVMRGKCHALELLFSETALAATEKLYQETPHNALIGEAISKALDRLPADQMVRILEIGAGTGGATSIVLRKLPTDRTDYVFTDISPLFTTKAREKFQEYAFLRYEVLNIEEDPEQQGFAAHQFDLILAANVLHATKNIRRTMGHVRQLLRPGGLLVLLEGTGPNRWVDLIFGLTDGWWRFEDADLRPAHPLLSARKWLDMLQETGFMGAVALPNERQAKSDFGQVLLLAHCGKSVPPASRQGSWLVFADSGNTSQELVELLRSRGDACVIVESGPCYEHLSNEHFTVNPTRPQDFEQLLGETLRRAGSPCRGVVHLWSLDMAAPDRTTAATLEADLSMCCGSVLHLIQAVARIGLTQPPRLWLVTRGSQPLGREAAPLSVAQAPLWGLGRGIALEHPEMWGGLVDLDGSSPPAEAALRLLLEINSPDGEDQVAYRGAERYVARLAHRVDGESAVPPVCCRADGTYLITGGLGGLGLQVARWMLERGARNVVLVGRSAPSDKVTGVLNQLQSGGTRIVVAQADVSEESQLAGVLGEIQRSMPPLRGVIHAAGVVDDAVLLQQAWGRFAGVFAAKVKGSWNLHVMTREIPLDFFVLFSTAASLLGSSGQGNHAAANAFMDALAHYRRAQDLPALSINWGPWNEVGAASKGDIVTLLAARGIDSMTPPQGLAALEHVLRTSSVQIGVLRVNWSKFFSHLHRGANRPFMRQFARVEAKEASAQPLELLQKLKQASPTEQVTILSDYLRDRARRVLGLAASSSLDLDQPLMDLGLDSLMAVELKNRIESDLSISVPLQALLENPNINGLVRRVLNELGRNGSALHEPPENESAVAVQSTEVSERLDNVNLLSDAEVDTMLNAMLLSTAETKQDTRDP